MARWDVMDERWIDYSAEEMIARGLYEEGV